MPHCITVVGRSAVAVDMLIIKPLAWLFRCVGIAPSRSYADKYISLAMLSATLTLSANLEVTFIANLPASMYNVIHVSGISFFLLSFNGFLVYNFFYRESYPSILGNLRDYENELHKIGARPQDPINMQYISVGGLAFVAVSRTVLISIFIGSSAFQTTVEVVLSTLVATALVQHLVLVSQLHSLFSALNDQLRRFSAAADDTPVDVMSSQLQSVFRIHTSLHVTVSDVNGHFFIYNFMGTIARLLICVTNMYGYLMSVLENKQLDADLILTFVLEFSLLIVQCVLCHACAKEANHTVLLAHHTLQPHTPIRLWQEVGDFSFLCINDKVHFSVGGVFTLNRPLITKLFTMALSYLIVAVQLQDVPIFNDNSSSPTSTADPDVNLSHLENVTADY